MSDIAYKFLWVTSPVSIIVSAVIFYVRSRKTYDSLKIKFPIQISKVITYIFLVLLANIGLVFTVCELFKGSDSEGAGWMIIVISMTDVVVAIFTFLALFLSDMFR